MPAAPPTPPHPPPDALARAQGCLLGQLAGDALGSLVEFKSPRDIARAYPDGVRDLADGGAWDTIAGQPTDDSEMALATARAIVALGRWDGETVRRAYVAWLASGPFDCGTTCSAGLRGRPNADSQANGALMRVAPIGIAAALAPPPGAGDDGRLAAAWADADAALTHPHRVCREANALFARALAVAIRGGGVAPRDLHARALAWADADAMDAALRRALEGAATAPPDDYVRRQGWVLTAFQNAWWQLLHASSAEEALIDTVGRGGDTDTNGAICGALLGAVHGRTAWPARWTEVVLACRPEEGVPRVRRPRPRAYWPVDALELAAALLAVGAAQPPDA